MRNRLIRQIGPYREIVQAAWRNRDQPGYAWRILRDGVCDGCALGTSGLRDWTMPDIHLCWIRLNLLRLNTMPSLDPARLADAASLESMHESDMRAMGRIPVPLIRSRGDRGFRPISWEQALDLMAGRLEGIDSRRLAFYLVSRGTLNETYYVAQKAARLLGTNHVDNSARVCHSPSTTGLKQSIGYPATTCSYSDLIGTDLVVFLGSHVSNNQPVMMKYLHLAKKKGTRVASINPCREPGLTRYWVPSTPSSALLGTDVCDDFFSIRVGGDIAFISGVLKHLLREGWLDQDFIAARTEGWADLVESLSLLPFSDLERYSGTSRERMLDFARLYAGSGATIFVWSMGVTMHRYGVENVKAIANLALARGNVGRPRTGLMAIRGHSGVQGGSEMGCVPNQYPGGETISEVTAGQLSDLWGFPVPDWKGYFVTEMVEAASREELEALYCVGSNLLGVLPDPAHVRSSLARIPLRIHHDIVLNPQMLVQPQETVLVLPATTRYEVQGGGTQTTTERRIIYSPEIPGPRISGARDEWKTLLELARRVRPDRARFLQFDSTADVRAEIARVVPLYQGIQTLSAKGDQFQWGGPLLGAAGSFPLAGGRARFNVVAPPQLEVPPGHFQLTTRRGKQFNSMVLGEKDLLMGTRRNEVLLAPSDLRELDLRAGDPVLVRSSSGQLRGIAAEGPVQAGTAMMYWPEANLLIPRGVSDPECGIPAFRDALVEVLPAAEADRAAKVDGDV